MVWDRLIPGVVYVVSWVPGANVYNVRYPWNKKGADWQRRETYLGMIAMSFAGPVIIDG